MDTSGWAARLAGYFIANSRLSLITVIALFVWGLGAFYMTPKQYNPTIVAPSFRVVIDNPGGTLKETLENVTKPMEHLVSDIPGVEDVYSVTTDGGRAVLNINFYVGEDFDSAKIVLNDRIHSRMNQRPFGARPPLISSVDPEDVPILHIALTSEKRSLVDLRKLAFEVRDRLRVIPGTSQIDVIGGKKRELAVLLDPSRQAHAGVSLQQMEQALLANNNFGQVGLVKSPNGFFPLEVKGTVGHPEDIRDLNAVVGDMGEIPLSTLAEIREQVKEEDEVVRYLDRPSRGADQVQADLKFHGSNSVFLAVAKLKGMNISSVSEAVKEELGRLQSDFLPSDVQVKTVVDEGETASREISGLVSNLISSIVIVVLVLVAFLSVRAALLVAVSIPLTLATVFGVSLMAGQNINRITLFALILSLGLLVDNATVVIENIVRHMGLKKSHSHDVIAGAVGEVGMGLLMSTVTTVLAFYPMVYITGMMGPYMGPIPFFVPAALIVAVLLSYTLNPWMASVFLKYHPEDEKKKLNPSSFKKNLDVWQKRAEAYLRNAIVNPWLRNMHLGILLALLVLAMLLPAVGLVQFRMLPKANRDQFFVYVDLKESSPLVRTQTVASAIEQELEKSSEVVAIESFVGTPPITDFNGLFRNVSGRRNASQATMRISLQEAGTREISSERFVLSVRPRLEELMRTKFPGDHVRLKLIEDPPGPPVLSTVLLRVQGWNDAEAEEAARRLLVDLRSVAQVVDTDISLPEKSPTLSIQINHKAASQARISHAQILDTLKTLYDGKTVGIYHNEKNIEEEYVVIRMKEGFRHNPDDLAKIFLHNNKNNSIPLSRLVEFVEKETPIPLMRENRKNTIYVYGEMGDRSVTYAAIDLLKLLWRFQPDGKSDSQRLSLDLFGAKYRTAEGNQVEITFGGEWELTLEVFRDLGIAMGVAIFLIYFVLVAQFSSLRDPLLIMSTIPLGIIGVLPGFYVLSLVNGEYFTATSMIGVIALAGIAVNNSIILLEYIQQLQKEGRPMVDALVEASVTRFRPIMLTSLTTILGSLTIVSDPVWAGLAWAIVFGLGVSSTLTVLVFPMVYYMFRRPSSEAV